jgi:hypothetical protein
MMTAMTATTAVATRGRGRHRLVPAETRFAVRTLGPDVPSSLALRLPGPVDPAEPADGVVSGLDPLLGNEIWRVVTPTTMLVGLRDTASAAQLLEVLDDDRLSGLRFRMSTARPASGPHDRPRAQDRMFGTMSALSTLLCWPGHARADLSVGAAQAATAALQHRRVAAHAEAALAMRWVVALAEAFPGDPMVLAPLLLKLRWFESGQEFLLPARWPSAMLSGDAVGVSGEGSLHVGGGLGTPDADPVGFVAGLESRFREELTDLSDDLLQQALTTARANTPQSTPESTPESTPR